MSGERCAMTRVTKTSRKRTATTRGARPATTQARAGAESTREGEAEQYAGAFARVRLVRAWIAVTAAAVAMLYAYVALLERVVKWWTSCSSRLAARFTTSDIGTAGRTHTGALPLVACEVARRRRYWARAALLVIGLLATAIPSPLHAGGGRPSRKPASARSRYSYVTITHSGNGTASVYTNATG